MNSKLVFHVRNAELSVGHSLFNRVAHSVFLLFLAVMLAGCCIYNHKFQKSQPPAMIGGGAGEKEHVDIGVVEFDDMGELFDRCDLSPNDTRPCQLTALLDWVTGQRESAAREGMQSVVVTFVHGWVNNAAPQNGDLQQFRNELRQLQENANGVQYIGVYLGWRGSSLPGTHWYEYVWTFFDRESGARRVASVSATEVLFRIRNSASKDLGAGLGRGKFILVGHSFGGLVVERTLAQALTALIVVGGDNKSANHTCAAAGGLEPFADLTVLINPAIDAIETQELIDMMKRAQLQTCSPNGQFDPPLLVSIKAQNDHATGLIFTASHTIESADKAFRPYGNSPELPSAADPKVPSQRSVYRHTAGAMSYFQNYCFIEKGEPVDKACKVVATEVRAERDSPKADSHGAQLQSREELPKSTTRYHQAFAGGPSPTPIIPNLYTRYRGKCNYLHCDVWNNTPYWIFTVPKDIVNGHGGWNNPKFASLLEEIIEQASLSQKPRTFEVK